MHVDAERIVIRNVIIIHAVAVALKYYIRLNPDLIKKIIY